MTTIALLPQTPTWSLWTQSEKTSYALCAVALLSSVLLQKIALPGTGGALPFTLVIFLALAAWGLITGIFEVNVPALISYAIFGLLGIVSAATATSAKVSLISLGYLLVVHVPLLFRIGASGLSYESLLQLLSKTSCICAAIGVLQFAAQFVIGRDLAFLLDAHLPVGLLMQGYNVMNPLFWGSSIVKSNGFFFLEPSFFCQFLAIGMIAELLLGSRILRIFIMGAGLVVSYSGTGLTTLALVAPLYVLRRKNLKLLMVGAAACVLLFAFADFLSLDAITQRLGEFSNDRSSGSARFLSIFWLLNDALLGNDLTFLLGRGPGTVEEFFERVPYEPFDPTWGKVVYEYGVLGALSYAAFFVASFVRGARGLRFAAGYNYFLLGGYLINPSVLMQMAALVVWPTQPRIAVNDTTSDSALH
jgi:hypothetical protein